MDCGVALVEEEREPQTLVLTPQDQVQVQMENRVVRGIQQPQMRQAERVAVVALVKQEPVPVQLP
jgi:hypothetical protein